jgi:hypothetical protein
VIDRNVPVHQSAKHPPFSLKSVNFDHEIMEIGIICSNLVEKSLSSPLQQSLQNPVCMRCVRVTVELLLDEVGGVTVELLLDEVGGVTVELLLDEVGGVTVELLLDEVGGVTKC